MTNDLRQHAYWEDEHGFRTYDHPVVRSFALQRINFVNEWLKLKGLKNALDVGCGNGFSTYYLHEYVPDIWAADRSGRMLSQHPMRGTGKLSMTDAFNLPFVDNSFDLVYGWEVLHHMSNPQKALVEMTRVSRQYVLIAEPNRNNPAQLVNALLDPEHRWVLKYSLAYMRNLIEAAGLKIENSSCGGWLFPNITPLWLLPLIKKLPYKFPLGISNWVLGSKKEL
jgi:ubiquinone/menaquinone biosynthesis C-methylase UbiE